MSLLLTLMYSVAMNHPRHERVRGHFVALQPLFSNNEARTNYLTSRLSSFLFSCLEPNFKLITYSGTDDFTHPPELFELPVFCEVV